MADSDNQEGVYPNFAAFRGARTQPVAQYLLREPEMRKIVYPGDDGHLAEALHEINKRAQRAGLRFDGWNGYTADVDAFIRAQGVGRLRP